ncbi:MAG: hypothetical protein ACXW4E_10500 [Anaerolineales bacterium]
MKFLIGFLTNLAIITVVFVVLYFVAHDFIDAGFLIISRMIGRGLSYLILLVLLLVAALPRK